MIKLFHLDVDIIIRLHFLVFILLIYIISFFLENGIVFSWGFNYNGELGLGYDKKKSSPFPKNIKSLQDKKIKRIFIGGFHNFCLSGNFIYFIFINIILSKKKVNYIVGEIIGMVNLD